MAMILEYRLDLFSMTATAVAAIGPQGRPFLVCAKMADGFEEAPFLDAVRALTTRPDHGEAVWHAGAVVDRAPAPSPKHEWDWGTCGWAISLEDAKALKLASINQWRDAREFAPFVWGALVFDATPDSLRRLSVAVGVARDVIAEGGQRTVTWTLADNSTVDLSAQDLVEVHRAYGVAMDAAHAQARALKNQARSAASHADLALVVVPSN